MRRGVTLIELAVTLVVFGIVFGLVTRSALFHLRMQRRAQAADAGERATRQAVAVLARALDGAGAGDLLPNAGPDSALDLMQQVAAGVGCVAGAELRTASEGAAAGGALAEFATAAKPGDRLAVLDDDAWPPRWLARTVVATAPAVQACAAAGVPPAPACHSSSIRPSMPGRWSRSACPDGRATTSTAAATATGTWACASGTHRRAGSTPFSRSRAHCTRTACVRSVPVSGSPISIGAAGR